MWKALKAAGGKLLKGAAGWQIYVGIAAAAVVALGSTIFWFNSKLEDARAAGADAQQVEQVKAELEDMRNVYDADKESQDAINQQLENLGALRARMDELERVREQDVRRFDRLVRSAPESAVRAHAAQAERDIAVVERQRDGFAAEAVQASTAAWGYRDTMLARREAIRSQRGQVRPNPEAKE